MSSSPDNFEKVQKLLKWKRHEQPPPRFFNEFSGRVTARIRAGETAPNKSWWELLGLEFSLKPVLAGVTAVAVCGLLIYGITTSLNEPNILVATDDNNPILFPVINPSTSPVGMTLAPAGGAAEDDSSTTPVLATDNPLTPSFKLQVKPVSFTPGN